MNGLLCVGALQYQHGFCKGETDDVSSIENPAIRLLNPRVRRIRSPEAFRPTVAEISSEEGGPVENRTIASLSFGPGEATVVMNP
jgi:hypothetical protein